MDRSIHIIVNVRYLNVPSDFPNPDWLQNKFEFNLSTSHTWSDVRYLLWKRSAEYFLKPVFVKRANSYVAGADTDKIIEFIGPDGQVDVVADLLLIDSAVIPRHFDPVDNLFDIVITYKGKTIRARESIECTVSVLKEYVLERESNKDVKKSDLKFYLVSPSSSYTVIESDMNESRLSQILRLDAPPFHEVQFLACLCPPHTPSTIFVKMRSPYMSDRLILQVDRFTTVNELKRLVMENRGPKTNNTDLELKMKYISDVPNSDGPAYDVLNFDSDHVVVYYRIDNIDGSEYFQPTPTIAETEKSSSDSNNYKTQEPLKIVVEGGSEWTPTGVTYEYIQSSNTDEENLLVEQSGLSDVQYEFALVKPGDISDTKVLLNTNQAMVVDNGFHEPYVLINPSGKAKLNKAFQSKGRSLIQEVQIEHFEEQRRPQEIIIEGNNFINLDPGFPPNEEGALPRINQELQNAPAAAEEFLQAPRAAPARGAPAQPIHLRLFRIANENMGRVFSIIWRYAFVIFVLDLHSLVLNNFQFMLRLVLILGSLYVLFFSGTRVTDWVEHNFLQENDDDGRLEVRIVSKLVSALKLTNTLFNGLSWVIVNIKNELVTIGITRVRDFEIIIAHDEKKDNWWYWVCDTWTNFWKDCLLFMLTLFPSCRAIIDQSLETWRSSENRDLKIALDTSMELVTVIIEQYQEVFKDKIEADGRTPEEILNGILGGINLGELGTDIESLNLEESKEEYYQIMLSQYRELKSVEKIFLNAIKRGEPITGARRRSDNNEINVDNEEQLQHP